MSDHRNTVLAVSICTLVLLVVSVFMTLASIGLLKLFEVLL